MANIDAYFVGEYQLIENIYEKGDIKLLKAFRKKPSGNKTTHFLIEILPSGRRKYISSLYPNEAVGTFHFEYAGVRYHYTEKNRQNVSIEVYV